MDLHHTLCEGLTPYCVMVLYLTVRHGPTPAPCVLDLHLTLCEGLTSYPVSWSYTSPCVMDLNLTLCNGLTPHPV